MENKLCGQCSEIKSLDQFTRARASKNFKTSAQTHHSYCKSCNASRARDWRKKHGTSYRGSGLIKTVPEEDRMLMSAIRQRLVDAKSRCRKLERNAPDLTADYLYQIFKEQNRRCAITQTNLLTEKDHPLCLSLDQIDPGKGYIKGNVQWLAWCVNRAKGDLSLDQFYEMCEVAIVNRKVQRLSP